MKLYPLAAMKYKKFVCKAKSIIFFNSMKTFYVNDHGSYVHNLSSVKTLHPTVSIKIKEN